MYWMNTAVLLKWMDPIWNVIKKRDKEKGYWLSKQQSASWHSWAGYTFEAICYKHIGLIHRKLEITPGSRNGNLAIFS